MRSRLIRRLLAAVYTQPVRRVVVKALSHIHMSTCTRLHTGALLEVDLDSPVGRSIWFRGTYETDVEAYLRSILQRGDIFIDIGANVGYFSIIASELVGQEGRVYAFEPCERIHRLLSRSVELNQLSNVICAQLAVGDKASFVRFNDMPASGFSHIEGDTDTRKAVADQSSTPRAGYSVQVVRLDDHLKPKINQQIWAIKVDVEGYEYAVLVSAEQLISTHLPDLVVEVQDYTLKRYHQSPIDVFSFLERFGYSGYEPKSMRQVGPAHCYGQPGPCNVIFTTRQ